MTTRFPPDNLPDNMQDYRRALETTLTVAETAQENTQAILAGMRQSVASNYGLGSRLTANAGSLNGKVSTSLHNLQWSPTSAVTLQRSWNNLGGVISIVSPGFTSNMVLSIAATGYLAVTGGIAGGSYSHWLRVQALNGLSGTRMVSRNDFSPVMLTWNAVPPSTAFQVRLQVWGLIYNPDGTIANGSIGTSSVFRMAGTLRAIALV